MSTHEQWHSEKDGLVTLLGYTLGVGTFLRFPYFVARNGGGAFLIPYVFSMAVCSLPVYFIELVVGQYYQRGPVNSWNLSPAFKGIGIGSSLIPVIYSVYSQVQYGWFFFYLYHCFESRLPWTTCNNSWNTPNCISSSMNVTNDVDMTYVITQDGSLENGTGKIDRYENRTSSAEEFWRYNTLAVTEGLENMGGPQWPLFAGITIIFVVFYLFMFKNIKLQGKIVYVTVFTPLILLTILLVRGCLLPGALDGILYYIKPDFVKLKNPKIWIEGCLFAFASLGCATGVVITSTSHNHFDSHCLRQAIIVVAGDVVVAIYTGFAVFSVMGYMAQMKGQSLETFESSGYDIAFITLPETVSFLPAPQLWAILLFLTVTLFAIDSHIPAIEVIVSILGDHFPALRKRRWLQILIVLIPIYLLSLPYGFQGGIYLYTLVDWFAWGPPLLFLSIIQTVVIGWVFGIESFDRCTQQMYGCKVPYTVKILIKFVTPLLLLSACVYSLYSFRPPKYGDYLFPEWANAIGWIMVASVVLPVPLWFAYSVWKAKGDTTREKLSNATTSVEEKKVQQSEIKQDDERTTMFPL